MLAGDRSSQSDRQAAVWAGLLGGFALVGRDGVRVRAGLAEGEVLERVGRGRSRDVFETLEGRDVGALDAREPVSPGGVDGGRDGLARLDGLEHVGRDAATLVVDVGALEGKCVAGLWTSQP